MIKSVSKQVRDQRNGVQVLLEKMNPKASAILILTATTSANTILYQNCDAVRIWIGNAAGFSWFYFLITLQQHHFFDQLTYYIYSLGIIIIKHNYHNIERVVQNCKIMRYSGNYHQFKITMVVTCCMIGLTNWNDHNKNNSFHSIPTVIRYQGV